MEIFDIVQALNRYDEPRNHFGINGLYIIDGNIDIFDLADIGIHDYKIISASCRSNYLRDEKWMYKIVYDNFTVKTKNKIAAKDVDIYAQNISVYKSTDIQKKIYYSVFIDTGKLRVLAKSFIIYKLRNNNIDTQAIYMITHDKNTFKKIINDIIDKIDEKIINIDLGKYLANILKDTPAIFSIEAIIKKFSFLTYDQEKIMSMLKTGDISIAFVEKEEDLKFTNTIIELYKNISFNIDMYITKSRCEIIPRNTSDNQSEYPNVFEVHIPLVRFCSISETELKDIVQKNFKEFKRLAINLLMKKKSFAITEDHLKYLKLDRCIITIDDTLVIVFAYKGDVYS